MAVPVGPDTSPISFLQKDPLESPQEQKLPVFKRSDSEERISATVHEKTLGLKVYYEKNPIEKWRLRQQLSKKAIFHQSYPGKKFEKW
jgi:hypothetical protein